MTGRSLAHHVLRDPHLRRRNSNFSYYMSNFITVFTLGVEGLGEGKLACLLACFFGRILVLVLVFRFLKTHCVHSRFLL